MEQSTTGDMDLGSQSVARLLIISGNTEQTLGTAQSVSANLIALNHQVSVAALDAWRDSLTLTVPEVVLVDCLENVTVGSLDATAQLCRDIKEMPGYDGVPVVVVLPETHSPEMAGAWEQLDAVCVDDIWAAGASRGELRVRVELLSRVGRLARDLGSVRDQLSKHLLLDEATQLMTRRFFFQAAFREVSRARRYGHHLSCLMIDIDFLENINRKFGDNCGDYVLRAVAYVVRQWTRDSDSVARFSDHKFVALLPETTIENATIVRKKIMRAMGETKFEWHGQELPVSLSIGEAETVLVDNRFNNTIAPIGDHSDEDDESSESHSFSVREELAALLEDADAALNVAKKTAKRPTIFVEYSPDTVGLPGSE